MVARLQLFSNLSKFRRERKYCDIFVIADDNKRFHCHRIELASESLYFVELFGRLSIKSHIIFIWVLDLMGLPQHNLVDQTAK